MQLRGSPAVERVIREGRPTAMPARACGAGLARRRHLRMLAAAIALSGVTVACAAAPAVTPGASSGQTPVPSGSQPAPTFGPDDVVHPTGAADVVLRYDVAGGFVAAAVAIGHVPQLTLYGDGRAIYTSAAPAGTVPLDGITLGSRLRTVSLAEAQVQELLKFALLEGGLGVAVGPYDMAGIADAPTTTFEIHADGNDRTVSAYALGIDGPTVRDAQIRAQLSRLADRLAAFGTAGVPGDAAWEPVSYRATLLDLGGSAPGPVRAWPWADIPPSSFRSDPANAGTGLRQRVLAAADARRLGVTGFEAGILAGLYVRLDDGSIVSLVLRPLLPDEAAGQPTAS